jgi:hypothetical protein
MGTCKGEMTLNTVIKIYGEDGIVITEGQAKSILEFLKKLATITIRDFDVVKTMHPVTKKLKSINSL